MTLSRKASVNLIRSWDGRNEKDGSYKEIIDIYNSYKGKFPRNVKMKYEWEWCACTWSAVAIKLGYTSIMPIEISCFYLIEAAKKMNCWQERDGYVPKPGDAVLYDWEDSGKGDNVGVPNHVGMVIEVYKDAGYFVVEEGNYNRAVKKRTVSINGKYIRGFITPKYDNDEIGVPKKNTGKDINMIAHEVITGLWDSGEKRKQLLKEYGYDYSAVQNKVNEILNSSNTKKVATCKPKSYDINLLGYYIATANLYCRNDAGTNKKALCKIPKDTYVFCDGYYTVFNGVKWYYIKFELKGIQYTGFSSGKYLRR
jgi:hypothetical protein